MASALLQKIAPYLIAPIYWLLSKTWRIQELGPTPVLDHYVQTEARAPCVYAHWHGDELVLVAYYSFRRLAVLASLSKDGTIMARALQLLGYQVFRGSSSKGGARGLIGLIKAVKEGSQAALAVDGPKGPIYEVKPGVVELAQRTGKPIIPVRTRCDRAWYVPRAWNRSYLPKPFARVEVEYGEPLVMTSPAENADELCAKIKKALDAIPGQSAQI
ncbi:MAG: lysophospholipid acyltransferase family protein [Bdellovibrionota bacterium]